MIFERAASDPEGLALDDGSRRRSWAELEDRVRRAAWWLRGEIGEGGHLALLLGNRVEAVELVVAGILAGVWVTPVSRHLTRDEIAHIVRDSGARLVVTDAERDALAREAGAPQVLRVGAPLDRLLDDASDAPPDPDAPAGGNMIYTSGTSGRPKGVKRRRPGSVAATLAAARAYGRRVALDGSGPHLVTGPTYHAAPLMFAVYDQLNGAPVLVMPRFEAGETLTLLAGREVHHTHLVPTQFVRLLRLPEAERAAFDAPALHLVLHGAAPVSPAVKRRMIDWWGEILVEYWGGTEAGVTTLVDSADWLAHEGTVGRALDGYEVFAVDDAGRRLPCGEEGMLYARHGDVPRPFEYHGDPDKTAAAYLEPGVFTLGDLGRVDADGFVHLSDRRSNLVITGGVNVYPAEVEHVLQEHPAVADVGVYGVPDEEWGERVKAAVELAPGFAPSEALADEIRAFGRERLAGYKVPSLVSFEPELPRHPTGKLLVRRLRDRDREAAKA